MFTRTLNLLITVTIGFFDLDYIYANSTVVLNDRYDKELFKKLADFYFNLPYFIGIFECGDYEIVDL